MRIVVCIKPTIESSNVSYDSRSGKPIRPVNTTLSEIERAALQTALDQKHSNGAHVTALSVADKCSDPLLNQALLSGADRAIRLWYQHDGPPLDTHAAGRAAAAAAVALEADLVICATRSADTSSGFFPTTLAVTARYELITRVLSLSCENGVFRLVQKLDGGWRAAHHIGNRAVVAIEPEIARIRHTAVLSRSYRIGLTRDAETWMPESVGLDDMPRSLVEEVDLALPRVRTRASAVESKGMSSVDRLRRKKQDGTESRQVKLGGSPEVVAKELLGFIQKWQA